jgi:manganese-dependent ADP-ribose/CDP-alcohol diphosphatase
MNFFRILICLFMSLESCVAFQQPPNVNGPPRRPITDSEPRFKVGVIADIQYAPIPDGFSHAGIPRYYQNALDAAKHAAQHFEKEAASLVLNLGDIIDGKCQAIEAEGGSRLPEGTDAGHECINHVLEALSHYQTGPILHTYGNHELYNLHRVHLGEKLNIPFVQEPCGDLVGYRSYSYNGLRFVVLDTNDISILQRCPDTSRKRKQAELILAQENPNFPEKENSPAGLEGIQKRFVAFNGAVDQLQLRWLRETLQEARQFQEKAIILSHQPILPESCSPVTLVWNFQEILEVLRGFSDVVVLSLSGHAHKGGYKRDEESGIHFRVVEAVLETPAPDNTYALMDVYHDRLIMRGYGNCASAEYDFSHCEVGVNA